VVQGFGAVGQHAARFLEAKGAVLVGVADSHGTLYNPQGLDIAALMELKQAGRSVIDCPDGERLDRDAVITLACDIWIPAARPDIIHEDNVHLLNTHLVIQGANIPITFPAEKMLHQGGVLCIPDFIANAGGVICAALEYRGVGETAALEVIEEKLRRNTRQVLETALEQRLLPRQAAFDIAVERVKKAMSYRRWSLYSTAPGFI
jgi:glutamate dehydrogenase (NAD(P)+)